MTRDEAKELAKLVLANKPRSHVEAARALAEFVLREEEGLEPVLHEREPILFALERARAEALRACRSLVFDSQEFYQHRPDGLKALEDVHRAMGDPDSMKHRFSEERKTLPIDPRVAVRAMTDEDRKAMFDEYCGGCGSADIGCQCWSDE